MSVKIRVWILCLNPYSDLANQTHLRYRTLYRYNIWRKGNLTQNITTGGLSSQIRLQLKRFALQFFCRHSYHSWTWNDIFIDIAIIQHLNLHWHRTRHIIKFRKIDICSKIRKTNFVFVSGMDIKTHCYRIFATDLISSPGRCQHFAILNLQCQLSATVYQWIGDIYHYQPNDKC